MILVYKICFSPHTAQPIRLTEQGEELATVVTGKGMNIEYGGVDRLRPRTDNSDNYDYITKDDMAWEKLHQDVDVRASRGWGEGVQFGHVEGQEQAGCRKPP